MKRKLIIYTGVKAFCISLAILLIFRHDLLSLWNIVLAYDWATYILVVPGILVYLLYQKRETLGLIMSFSRTTLIDSALGLATCVFSLLIYIYSLYTPYSFYLHIISLVLFTAGGILVFFGFRILRTLAFPVCYLLLLYPLPIELLNSIGMKSAAATANLSFQILTFLRMPVTLSGGYEVPVISYHTSSGQTLGLAIATPCAGVYSLMGFAAAIVFLMYIARGTLWKKVVVGLIGSTVIYLLNIFRVCTVVTVAYYYNQELALTFFHTFGGWILVLITTLLSFYVANKLLKIKFNMKNSVEPCEHCDWSKNHQFSFCQDCGRIFSLPSLERSNVSLGLKIVTLLTVSLIFTSTTFPFFTMQNIKHFTSQTQEIRPILPELSQWTPVFSTRFYGYEEVSKEDLILLYFYVPKGETQFPPIRVIYEVSSGSVYAQGWRSCIEKTEMDLRSYRLVILRETPPKISGYSIVIYSHGMTMVVLRWVEPMLFEIGSTMVIKNVGVSLVATTEAFTVAGLIDDPQDHQGVAKELTRIGRVIVEHWQPARELWSLSLFGHALKTFFVSFWELFVTSCVVFIVASLAIWAYRSDKKSLMLEEILGSLSDKEKLALLAVAQIKHTPIGSRVYNEYTKLSGEKALKTSHFLRILSRLKQLNLIRNDIIIKDDEAHMVWRSTIPL